LCIQALKRLTAIFVLTLLFFNWYGYRLVSGFLQKQSDVKLEARFDNNDYDESQLIEIRVPMHLPYHNDWTDYERFDGEVEIKGVHYKYVKRKVENGELVLLCLPNNEKQMLQSARDNFFKLVNDLQQPNSGKKSNSGNSLAFKILFSDYQQEKNNWSIASVNSGKKEYRIDEERFVISYYSNSPEQPPELA
jgi:hypothetical protein